MFVREYLMYMMYIQFVWQSRMWLQKLSVLPCMTLHGTAKSKNTEVVDTALFVHYPSNANRLTWKL